MTNVEFVFFLVVRRDTYQKEDNDLSCYGLIRTEMHVKFEFNYMLIFLYLLMKNVRRAMVLHALIYHQKDEGKEKKDHDDKSDTKEKT